MTQTKKIISAFFALIVAFSATFIIAPALAVEDTTAVKLNLRIVGKRTPDSYTEDGTPVYKAYSGEPLSLRGTFEISGTDVNIPYGSARIWMPKDPNAPYINSVTFVDSINATETIQSGNNNKDEFFVQYNFNKLTGGDVGAYPFFFNFENMITPNGTRQPIYLALLDADGNVVYNAKTSIIVESVAISSYTGTKYVHNHMKEWNRHLGDYPRGQRPIATPTDLAATRTVFYNEFIANPPAGAPSGQGEYAMEEFMVEDTIPEGAVFLTDDPVNAGWTLKEGTQRTYVKTVTVAERPEIRTSNRFNIPIALSFPDAPYGTTGTTNSTQRFVNTTKFYYHNGTEFVHILDSSAAYQFHVREEPPGAFSWVKVADQPNNVINVDQEAYGEYIAYKPNPLGNTGINVWPRTGDEKQHEAFTWTTTFKQWQRDTNTNTHYMYQYLDVNQGIHDTGGNGLPFDHDASVHQSSGRFYYESIRLNKATFYNDGATNATEAHSTVNWVNENTKFKAYKTFAPQSGYPFTLDSHSRASQTVATLPAGSVYLGTYKLGDTIEIKDEGGYYTGIAFIFDDPELNNTDAAGNPIRALPMRNMQLTVDVKKYPVKPGSVSRGANGEVVYTAPENYNILQKFSDRVLGFVGDGLDQAGLDRAAAQKIRYLSSAAAVIRETTTPPTPVPVTTVGQWQESWEHGNMYFTPNFPKLDLTTSGSKIFTYSANPENMKYIGNFNGSLASEASSLVSEGTFEIRDLKGVVLLPPGVEYVRTINLGNALEEPAIVENYKNTGRTAIVYRFGDYKKASTGTISYELRVTKYATDSSLPEEEKRNNKVETWLAWDNNLSILARGGATLDKYDLNNDNIENKLDLRTYVLEVFMPQEVILRNTVAVVPEGQNYEDVAWQLQSPYRDIDDDVALQARIINKWTSPITKLTAADVLPATGDRKIVANHDGEYLLRGTNQQGSQFNIRLNGPLEDLPANGVADEQGNFPEGSANQKFTFYYSTATPQQANPDVVDPNSWKLAADITDWSQVTAVKFVLKPGQIIPAVPPEDATPEEVAGFVPGSNEVAVYFDARVNNDKTTANQQVAWNSSAYMQGAGRELNEGNEIQVPTIRYTVSGIAFRDYKMNAKVNDSRLPGITARLVYAKDGVDTQGNAYRAGDPVPAMWVDTAKLDANGNVELDKDGNLIPGTAGNQMVTDSEGNYGFIVYKRGDYRVEFTRDTNLAAGRITDVTEQKFVQCLPDPDTKTHAAVKKSWNDVYGNLDTVSSTDFALNPYNLAYTAEDKLDMWSPSLHAYRNVAINDGRLDLKIHKVGLDKDGLEVGALADTTFELHKRQGDTQGELVGTQTTNNAGDLVFKNIPYGDYYLTETQASAGYRTINKIKITVSGAECAPSTVKTQVTFQNTADDTANTAQHFSYDAENNVVKVTNNPILAKLQVVKKAADTQALQAGVTFGLYRDGNPVMDNTDPANPQPLTATTDEQGVAVFSNIAGGEYVVKEITAKRGYTSNEFGEVNGVAGVVDLRTTGKTVIVPSDPTKNMEENLATLNISNEPIRGSVRVIKRDADDTTVPLAGVSFSIFACQGSEDERGLKTCQGTEPNNEANALATVTTNEQGTAEFSNVVYGRYLVVESKALPGYLLDKKAYPVEVTNDGRPYNITPGKEVLNTQYRGDISIVKLDRVVPTQKLANATFELYKCNGTVDSATRLPSCGTVANPAVAATPVAQATTNAQGVAEFTNLVYGKYLVKETTAPAGYVLPASYLTVGEKNLLELTVSADAQTQYTATNEREKGSVSLVKVDALDTTKPVAGAQFALFAKQADGSYATTPFTFDGVTFQGTTNEQGELSFAGVPIGEYQLKEIAAPQAYLLGEQVREVNITAHEQVIEFTSDNADNALDWFTNQPKLYSVAVAKVDEAGNALTGASFAIYPAQNTGTAQAPKWVKSGARIGAEQAVGTDGKVTFSALRPGNYVVEETVVPTGYVGTTELIPVTLTATENNGHVTEISVANTKILGSVRFVKVDADSYAADPQVITPLAGATFQIFAAKQEDGKWVKSGDSLASVTTNVDGVVEFTDLPQGHYIVEETGTSLGYEMPADPSLHVEISTHEQVWTTQDGYFTNAVIKGKVSLQKQGTTYPDGTGAQPLAGATFALQQNGETKYTAVSDTQGLVEFLDVLYGTYQLVELSAPTGYVADLGSQEVTIATQGEHIELADPVINQMIRNDVRALKVDARTGKPLAGAEFGLFACIGEENVCDTVAEIPAFTATSNEAGELYFADVLYGTYHLREITAPTGYQLSTKVVEVVVSEQKVANDAGEFNVVDAGRVVNDPIPASPPTLWERVLAKTGAARIFWIATLAGLTLVSGLGLMWWRRKQDAQQQEE